MFSEPSWRSYLGTKVCFQKRPVGLPRALPARKAEDGDVPADAQRFFDDLAACRGWNVLQHIGGNNRIELLVLEGQLCCGRNDRSHRPFRLERK